MEQVEVEFRAIKKTNQIMKERMSEISRPHDGGQANINIMDESQRFGGQSGYGSNYMRNGQSNQFDMKLREAREQEHEEIHGAARVND